MIWTISDLHFSGNINKYMDIFGPQWLNHEDKIIKSWKEKVGHDDLVLVAGDISWAMDLEDAYVDLAKIDSLPGMKVMLKGNHDYWWQSLKKVNSLGLESLFFLQNNSYKYKNIGIYGTRGWIPKDSETFTDHDEKIYLRELMRLENSLTSKVNGDKILKKIVMMHYPPFNYSGEPTEFVEVMKRHGVNLCVYGHLHAEGHQFIREGNIEKIEFICSSSDYVDFQLVPIGGKK